MKPEEISALMRSVSTVVKDQLERTIAPLIARIEAAENKPVEPPEPGRDGRDADVETIRSVVVSEMVKLPKPRDGQDGIDGRDAFDLEIRTSLSPSKSYQRGTVASFRGGIVRAFRATDPLGTKPDLEKSGWQVLLNGIAEEEEEDFDHGRILQRSTTYTSGQRMTRNVKRHVPIYRGVYSTSEAYERGDTVTYGGSMWICKASSPTKIGPGAAHELWQMCVRRGSNGKDAEK